MPLCCPFLWQALSDSCFKPLCSPWPSALEGLVYFQCENDSGQPHYAITRGREGTSRLFIPALLNVVPKDPVLSFLDTHRYIVYDVQQLMGGTHQCKVSPDEYVFAGEAEMITSVQCLCSCFSIPRAYPLADCEYYIALRPPTLYTVLKLHAFLTFYSQRSTSTSTSSISSSTSSEFSINLGIEAKRIYK